jgi:DNA-binding PadR family transcriptional regulator
VRSPNAFIIDGKTLSFSVTANWHFKVNRESLLTAFQRLERMGWLDSEWRQTDNSRRAKFYPLTRAGKKQLEIETSNWTRRASAIARLLNAEV